MIISMFILASEVFFQYIYVVEKGLQQSLEKLNSTPPLVFGFFYRISRNNPPCLLLLYDHYAPS
jgi:hypothetical protein